MEQKIKFKDNSSIYKMIIPLNVERKIKYFIEKIYNTEWSGILFYDYEGSLSKGLTVTCRDILIMNRGNSTFTSFEVNEEILPYMIENDLLNCQHSLIHSHHSLCTNFSGTDINTLEERAILHNNFVSLIVNNDGNYKAAITWKTKSKDNVTSLFGKEETIEIEECENIYYSYMTIEREFEDNELNERIKQLIQSTVVESIPNIQSTIVNKNTPQEEYVKQSTLNFEENYNYNFEIDSKFVEEAAAQLISLNLLAKRIPTEDKIDEVLQSLVKRIKERFDDDTNYPTCLEQFVDCVLTDISEKANIDSNDMYNNYDVQELLARQVKNILIEYSSKAKYIKDIIDIINDYYGN